MEAPVNLPVGSIYPRRNGRPVDKRAVSKIAASIEAIGLQTPITVTPTKRTVNSREVEAYEIVAGRHRYEAAISLKRTHINAYVQVWDEDDASLWEIDENLIRAELTDAQRADHHVRREAILVRKGLVAGRGGDRKSKGQVGTLKSYSDEAAASLGVSQRTVKRDLARGKKIAPDVLAKVSGTDLDKGVVLDRLAKTAPAQQSAALSKILEERTRVPLARPPLNDDEAVERHLSALMNAWNKASPEARSRFLARVAG
jgi:hypothetical protein